MPNKRFQGRVRCAIRLVPEELGEDDYRAEQGWKEGKNWKAYRIIEVRKLFTHCNLKQSCEGRPWKIFTDDEYLEETSKLLAAIHMGLTITPEHAYTCIKKIRFP